MLQSGGAGASHTSEATSPVSIKALLYLRLSVSVLYQVSQPGKEIKSTKDKTAKRSHFLTVFTTNNNYYCFLQPQAGCGCFVSDFCGLIIPEK